MSTAETGAAAAGTPATEHQQHPIGIYVKVWILLFVLSRNSSAQIFRYSPIGCC